jgi:acyl-CoA reductase-like NAD-dependent aldehyde dehydrogenase
MEALQVIDYQKYKSSETISITTPLDGSVIGTCHYATAEQINQAVESAHKAYSSWSLKTYRDRALLLMKFHALVQEHTPQLVDLICKEHGKTQGEALGEISKGLETVLYAISLSQLQDSQQQVSRGVTCVDVKRPLGVVVSIVPFNFPFMVPFWTIPIALVLGNTMVIKPSEKVPLTMGYVMSLFEKAEIPAGVIQLVNGSVQQVNTLVQHPLVKGVTFVGTSHVAQLLYHRISALDKRVLALGGAKNHLVAYNDCDIEMASTDIVNSFTGCAGQRCMAASTLLLIGEQPELLSKIIEKSKGLKPGQGKGEMGPVIDVASKNRIISYIEDSVSNGATVLLDGRSKGWTEKGECWIGPTILLHKNRTDKALHDEIFGPVLSILVVSTKEEALEIENANPYGNAGTIT